MYFQVTVCYFVNQNFSGSTILYNDDAQISFSIWNTNKNFSFILDSSALNLPSYFSPFNRTKSETWLTELRKKRFYLENIRNHIRVKVFELKN